MYTLPSVNCGDETISIQAQDVSAEVTQVEMVLLVKAEPCRNSRCSTNYDAAKDSDRRVGGG